VTARFGALDADVVGLCEEALAALPPQPSALRAKTTATLVYHRAYSGAGWSVDPLAVEAIDVARDSGDQEALALALWSRWLTLTGAGRPTDELATADELLAVAIQAGDLIQTFNAHHWRAMSRLALGDIGGFDADVAALMRIAEDTHLPDEFALGSILQATRALLDGRFDDAEELTSQVLERTGDDPNFVTAYAALTLWLHFERGRLEEFKPVALAFIGENPDIPGFQAARAVLHAELGEIAQAQEAVDALMADDLASCPRDGVWPATLVLLAEAVARLRDRRSAEVLYGLLSPYAGHLVLVASGAGCVGAADRYLGMMAGIIGDTARAKAHYEAALALERRVGSAPLLARTEYWYAHDFLRDDPGSGKGLPLLQHVLGTAQQLGMKSLETQAHALIGRGLNERN
jgi:hypothetical protein